MSLAVAGRKRQPVARTSSGKVFLKMEAATGNDSDGQLLTGQTVTAGRAAAATAQSASMLRKAFLFPEICIDHSP